VSRPRISLLSAALLLSIAVVGLWSTEGRASTSWMHRIEPSGTNPPVEVVALATPREPLPLAPTAPAGPAETAREFLEAWHGERWADLEPVLVASGLDLDQPYSQRPWEEVAPVIEARIGVSPGKRAAITRAYQRWPEVLEADFVRRRFSQQVRDGSLDETDLGTIADLVAPTNSEIAAHAELYGDLLDLHVRERWQTGRYVRAPFTTEGIAAERGFHSESHGADGWAVTITLSHAECPDLVELEQEMGVLCRERDALVEGYLRAR
jgi:hypothetical protein